MDYLNYKAIFTAAIKGGDFGKRSPRETAGFVVSDKTDAYPGYARQAGAIKKEYKPAPRSEAIRRAKLRLTIPSTSSEQAHDILRERVLLRKNEILESGIQYYK
jgi:hypothetical protein